MAAQGTDLENGRDAMRWLLLMVATAGALVACNRGHKNTSADNTDWILHTTCKVDADCFQVPDRVLCCSTCGIAPEHFVAINTTGRRARKKQHDKVCEGSPSCPLLSCPIIRYCETTKPLCHKGRCMIKRTKNPGCKAQRDNKR